MYNTNIVIGSKKGDLAEKEGKCDTVAVYMPDDGQLLPKQPKECIDYRSYLPVYQPTTFPLERSLKKDRQRRILLGLLFAVIIILFMTLGGTIGYGIYKGMF